MTVIKDEYISKRVVISDLLPLSFMEMSPYTGSKGSLRYRIEKETAENEAGEIEKRLLVYSWSGPFSFDNTSKEEMDTAGFPFSEEGRKEIIEYLNSLIDKSR